jgi:hypothetical protein
MWLTVMADLHRRCGNSQVALHFKRLACATAPNQAGMDLLMRRLELSVIALPIFAPQPARSLL